MRGEVGEVVDIFGAGTGEEADIATDGGRGGGIGLLEGIGGAEGGGCVGHAEDLGEAAGEGGGGTGGKIFFMFSARDAEMGVDIDEAG